MRRQEVDRAGGRPAGVVELHRAARQPLRHVAQHARVAPPEGAHVVAGLVVPLAERPGEAADLIAAIADVPGLGDQLDAREHRVLPDRGKERAPALEPARLAPERGGKVEAEAVHMHLGHPVAQGIQHHAQHHRMRDVQRVAGAGGVETVARILGQHVVARVVDAAERQRRAHFVAFAGVVVDHVEDDLDAGGVKAVDGALDLGDLARFQIGPVRREERQRVVAPVVLQPLFDQVAVVGKGVDRQQFDRGDADPLAGGRSPGRRRARQRCRGRPARRRDGAWSGP